VGKKYKVINLLKKIGSRAGSLLLLLQKSPVAQWILPEARLAGGASIGELTKWTVATFAGLGAYDSVAGATAINQLYPTPNSNTVKAAAGSSLSFAFSINVLWTPKSWQVVGPLPNGLTLTTTSGQTKVNSIAGVPTSSGNYPITIVAWQLPSNSGYSYSQNFTINVGTAIITSHPSSVAISSGASTTLSVTGSGSPLTYQWYSGESPSIISPITDATSSTFTTPALSAEAKYWVRVTRDGVIANSNTAVVSIQNPPVIDTQPNGSTIDAGQTASMSVATSGNSLTYQWYRGTKGNTAIPVASATNATLITPVLSSTTSYWVRVTSGGLSIDSEAALVTVREPYVTWSNSVFTAQQLAYPQISGSTADPDGDGLTNNLEFVAGTSPTDGSTASPLTITRGTSQLNLSFVAKAASGAGYYGSTRRYALEESGTLTTEPWTPVADYGDIIGTGQTVTYTIPPGSNRKFYRLKLWLMP
jgi:hypothetical protein